MMNHDQQSPAIRRQRSRNPRRLIRAKRPWLCHQSSLCQRSRSWNKSSRPLNENPPKTSHKSRRSRNTTKSTKTNYFYLRHASQPNLYEVGRDYQMACLRTTPMRRVHLLVPGAASRHHCLHCQAASRRSITSMAMISRLHPIPIWGWVGRYPGRSKD